jgi:hypothetical protein
MNHSTCGSYTLTHGGHVTPDILGLYLGILGIVITAAIAIYAILDARGQVKKSTELQRNIAYLRLKDDLMWMFVDPTDGTYPSAIAKAFHEFDLFAKALNPNVKSEVLKEAVENEALEFAAELVNKGTAVWKEELNLDAVNEKLSKWRADKNKVRAARLLSIDDP